MGASDSDHGTLRAKNSSNEARQKRREETGRKKTPKERRQ